MDAIIAHGNVPGAGTLVNEPNLLVQNLTVTPQRTETRFKGPNRATQGITETDPVMDFAFSAIVSTNAGLADGHPGTQVIELENFKGQMHGFHPLEGTLIFRDPSKQKDTENPDQVSFTVTHFPFVRDATRPPPYMVVTGTLTDGETPTPNAVVFPTLVYDGIANEKPQYASEDSNYTVGWNGSIWQLIATIPSEVDWESTADVATPDLVPPGAWHETENPHAWKPTSPATGTPVVTAVYNLPSS
jgi:hypothetical protein